MVKDAEAHREDDKKFHELVQTRNQADGLIHATTKAMADAGDKITADERSQLESAISALKEVIKSDDKAKIEAAIKTLTDASGKMSERLYAKPSEGEQQQAGGAEQAAGAGSSKKEHADVVDAEFEEVKDKK